MTAVPAIRRAACLAVLALTATAPRAGDLALVRTGGVLGETIAFELAGDALEVVYVQPSVTQGPVPVALFCPGDPRLILVGPELSKAGKAGVLSASGGGSVLYPLPATPALQGAHLFTQAMTLFGPGCLIGDLSAQNALTLAQHDTVHPTIGLATTARQGHTATALLDGTVLIAGGDEPDASGALTALDTLELFDPQTQRFTALADTLSHPRSTHTATLLQDGRVLIAGGYDASGTVRATAEIFDPATGTLSPAAPMSTPRTQHTATLLADGRVLVIGGSSKFDLGDVLGSLAQAKRSAEVYDPAAGAWTSVPDLPMEQKDGVIGHGASRLGDGRVLVTGGVEVDVIFGIPIPSLASRCHRYDPQANSWIATASLPGARVYHGQTTLPDGRAVIAGGAVGDFVLLSFSALASVARYDGATNAWTQVAPLGKARAYPNVLVAGDEVVVAGGLATVDVTTGSGLPEQAIEVAPLSLAGWTAPAALALPREVARAVAVEGGDRVLVVGTGDAGPGVVDRTAEVYVR